MKTTLLTLSILFLLSTALVAQHASEEAAVKEVVKKLFLGMQKGDSAMVHDTFVNNPTFATAFRTKTQEPALHLGEKLQEFLDAVGKPHKEVWNEEIWNVTVKIDADFAQVWCDYAFYLDHTFSHCGVDAFHLHKTKSGWKIFHLADTRRKDTCDVPADIKKKHP